MFDFLQGQLIEKTLSYAVILVHGVGYKVITTPSSISTPVNQLCTLYTSLIVRENFQALYGFVEKSSRDLFEVLLNVSGIGPKIALCIVSQFTPQAFKDAVVQENIARLSSVPGLGKKTAEKIVLELKDKLMKTHFAPGSITKVNSQSDDAIQALINLGFSDKNAAKAIEKVMQNHPKAHDLSEIITLALRQG